MHLRGHKTSDEGAHDVRTGQQRSEWRGGWYADPFGKAGERWWDGTKWTGEVRGPPTGTNAEAPRPKLSDWRTTRATDPPHTDEPRGPDDESPEFAAGILLSPGTELRVAPRDPKPYGHYDLLTGHDPVAALILGGKDALASMICADGAWYLKKRRRVGWELLIESYDGQHLGWYSGRHWLPGGTIILIDGTHVDLRRSLKLRWKLQATDDKERLLDIRTSGLPSAQKVAVTVRFALADPTQGSLLVLTSCAVLMLQRMMGFVTLSSAQ